MDQQSSILETDYEGFTEYLKGKEQEDTTVSAYRNDVKRFKAWLEINVPKLTWHELKPFDLSSYLISLKGSSYHNRVMNSLRHWFDYLKKEKGFKDTNPARRLAKRKSKVHPSKYLTVEGVKCLIEVAHEKSRKAERHRNASLIAFMYGTGLRISEVCAFKLEDIRFHEEHAQAIVVGSGKRERLVVLSEAAKKSLGSWLIHKEHAQAIVVGSGKRKRLVVLSEAAKKSLGSWLIWSREHFGIHPEDHDGYIWVTVAKKSGTRGRGTPLDRQAISQMLERYRVFAEIKQKVTPQVLRNTFAHELEMAGVQKKVIGAILGYQGVEVYSPESPSESVDGVAEKAVGLLPDVWQE